MSKIWPRAQEQSLNLEQKQLAPATSSEFRGDVSERSGVEGLEALNDVTMVCVPDLMTAPPGETLDLDMVKAVQTAMIAHCERLGDRVACQKPHQGRTQGGRHTSGRHHCPGIQARLEPEQRSRKDGRLEEDDIGHRQERGQAGEDFGPDVGAVLTETEESFKVVHDRNRGAFGVVDQAPWASVIGEGVGMYEKGVLRLAEQRNTMLRDK